MAIRSIEHSIRSLFSVAHLCRFTHVLQPVLSFSHRWHALQSVWVPVYFSLVCMHFSLWRFVSLLNFFFAARFSFFFFLLCVSYKRLTLASQEWQQQLVFFFFSRTVKVCVCSYVKSQLFLYCYYFQFQFFLIFVPSIVMHDVSFIFFNFCFLFRVSTAEKFLLISSRMVGRISFFFYFEFDHLQLCGRLPISLFSFFFVDILFFFFPLSDF